MPSLSYLKRAGQVALLAAAVGFTAPQALAEEMGSMRVAFGDVPGGEMTNFMIAVARAAERGVNVETIRDVAYALPPFDRTVAMHLLDKLQLRPLLDGLRDRPAVDASAFCIAAERFSMMAAALGNTVNEIDVNPVIVHPNGCIAVDALVIGHVPGS